MAVYKVPQDVEAEDKLLGPFTFRQFIYLIIVAMMVGLGFVLYKVFPGLVVIPLPFILFFGTLALPLKKDQPMETYLGGLISFYLIKPRKRLWQPDGIDQLIEITAPKEAEPDRVKHLSQEEATQRLDYLTDIVESRGWAVRGVGVPTHGVTSMNQVAYHEAKNAPDLLDDTTRQAQRFDAMIQQQDQASRQKAIESMHQATSQYTQYNNPQQYTPKPASPQQYAPKAANPQNVVPPYVNQAQPPTPTPTPIYKFDPYPEIHQSVVAPISEKPHQSEKPRQNANNIEKPAPEHNSQPTTKESTSENTPSPDIIKLANESEGLTVADVAHQAQRLNEKKHEHGLPEDEVEISLH